MNRERCESLSDAHRVILDDISGQPFSMELARSFHHADELAQEWKDAQIAAGKLSVEWIVVSDEERARMEAAAAKGMEAIYADYAERGIPNAREIYEALNR